MDGESRVPNNRRRTHEQLVRERTFTDVEFVTAWMNAYQEKTGLMGVAQTLGITKAAVGNEANRLRNHGVNLPRISNVRAHHKIDANNLNKFIEQSL